MDRAGRELAATTLSNGNGAGLVIDRDFASDPVPYIGNRVRQQIAELLKIKRPIS